ncbi:hypothetical protein CPB85DRAFT_1259169 [Mucidula mucida]|nr:hypothetical protein CPB85DRAFT_1259169 [Mucidula mucida]
MASHRSRSRSRHRHHRREDSRDRHRHRSHERGRRDRDDDYHHRGVRETEADTDTTIESEVMMEIEKPPPRPGLRPLHAAPREWTLRPREQRRGDRGHGEDLVKGMMALKLDDSTQTHTVSIAGERRGRHQKVIAAAPYQSAYQTVNANPYQDTNWNVSQNTNANPYQTTTANPYQNTPPASPYNAAIPSRAPTPIIPGIVTPGAAAALNGWEDHAGGQWSSEATAIIIMIRTLTATYRNEKSLRSYPQCSPKFFGYSGSHIDHDRENEIAISHPIWDQVEYREYGTGENRSCLACCKTTHDKDLLVYHEDLLTLCKSVLLYLPIEPPGASP